MNQAKSRVFKRLFFVFAPTVLAVVFGLMVGTGPMQAQGTRTIQVVVNPSTLTADGASTAAVTVTVTGTAQISGVQLYGCLSPSTLGSVDSFTPTDELGQTFSTWTASFVAGSGELCVVDGSVTGTASITLTAGALYTITLQVSPTSLIAHSYTTSTIVARALDAHDNPVPGVPLGHSISPGTLGSVSDLGTTDSNGQASGTWTAGTVIGSGTLSVGNGSITHTSPISLTAGEPQIIKLQANPTSRVVPGSVSLKATITDTYGNRVPDALVTFESSIGSPSPSTDTTDENGIAISSLSSTQAGTAYITATSGSAQGLTTVTFLPGPPSNLTLDAQPASQVVGNSSVLTATVRDQFSNLVGSGLQVTFTKDLGSIVRYGTTMNGIATSSISSTLAGTAHVTATCQGASGSTVVTFTPGAPYTITLRANPTSLFVGYSSALTAIVTDTYGNRVPGALVTFDSSIGDTPPSATTNGNGVALSSMYSEQRGTAYITATSNSTRHGYATVTFKPDVPNWLTLDAWPTTQVVSSSSVLTATVYDHFDNLVADNTPVTFTVNQPGTILSPRMTTNGIATSRVTVTLASLATVTASAGGSVNRTAAITFTVGAPYTLTLQAGSTSPAAGIGTVLTATVTDRFRSPVVNGTVVTFTSDFGTILSPRTTTNGVATSWISWTLLGTVHITATSGSARDSMAVNFVPNVPATVTLQAIPTLLVVGNSSVLTATVVDQFGHYVADGTVVTLTTDLGHVLSPVTTTTGIATSVISSTQAGVAHITATSGSAQGFATVTFASEVPATVALQADPTSPVVGNSSVLTATVRDRYNNLVASGFLVTFTTDLGSVISPGTTADGVATSSISARLAGTAHITATCESIPGATVVSFVPDVPSALTLQADPTLQIVGKSSVLTATVRDRYDNLVASGFLVTFTTDLGSVISPVTTTNGIATSSVSSTLPGIANIVATSGVAQGTASVTFVPDASATTTSVQLGTDTLLVNSNMTTTITVTYSDFYGNPVPGVHVTGSLSPTTLGDLTWLGPTDANGRAIGSWKAGTVVGSGILVVGNSSITVTLAPRRVLLPLVMRDFPPSPVAKSLSINGGAEFTYQITVTLEVSATMASDYVEQMRFSNDSVHWSDWLTFAPTTTWKLASNNGLAVVYAQFKGHSGGISAVTSDDILLFKNGDFSRPNLADWTLDPNSKLSVVTSTDPSVPNNPAGRLGNPAYACFAVPIGYGSLSQSFIMPKVPTGKGLVLEFSYHIITDDRNVRLDDKGDRFDVLFNNILVFSAMNQTLDYKCAAAYDLGRKVKSVSVGGNPGDNINVIFRLYNRPDSKYNTYVYLDDVHLHFE
jgi:adhesin/invasin